MKKKKKIILIVKTVKRYIYNFRNNTVITFRLSDNKDT